MSWENDERGKLCKWMCSITVADHERIGIVGTVLPVEKREQLDAAFKECWTAVNELVASGEYVVIVQPQIIEDRDTAAESVTFIVRARVRWVTPQAKANRERNLQAMFDAADDEFEKVMTERAGGTPN